jgi:phage protein D
VSQDDPLFYAKVLRSRSAGGDAVDISDRVTQLVYEDKESTGNAMLGGADRLVLTVDNFDLLNFDQPFVRTGWRVEVAWGYPGRMSPPRTCTVQKVMGALSLTVEARGVTVLLHKHPRIRTHSYVKLSDVAALIAGEAGYGPELQHIEDTVDVEPQVTQARMTDAAMMRELCRRTGFVWYIDVDGFHFHRRRLGQKPVRTFRYYTDRTGDVLSFNVENDVFARRAGGVTVAGRDPNTKKPISAQADNSTSGADTTLAPERVVITGISARDGSVTGDFEKESGSTHVTGGATDARAAKKLAAAGYHGSQLAAAILTLDCRGDPHLLAKSVVRVEGIGRLIEGNYYVRSVTHTVGSGYVMQVKALRSGVNASGGVAAKGPQNNAAPPARAAGDPGANAELVAKVNARDGSVSFVEGRGRTLDDAPADNDPLGLIDRSVE